MTLDMVWAEIAVAALAGSAFYGSLALPSARRPSGTRPIEPDGLNHERGEAHDDETRLARPTPLRWRRSRLGAGGQAAGQGDAAAQMGDAGAVRRLLRRQGQGLLQGRRARRDDQAGRPGHRPAAGDRRRRRRRDRRLDAVGAGDAREGRAAGQHRPALQEVGHDADLPRGDRHQDAGGLQGQDARRLVLRQRVSVPVLDGQARLSRPTARPAA